MRKNQRFFIVFCITFFTTMIVGTTSLLMGRSLLSSLFYALVSMWIMGIASQILVHHLYLVVVKPSEDRKEEEKIEKSSQMDLDLDSLEEIDDMVDADNLRKRKDKNEKTTEG